MRFFKEWKLPLPKLKFYWDGVGVGGWSCRLSNASFSNLKKNVKSSLDVFTLRSGSLFAGMFTAMYELDTATAAERDTRYLVSDMHGNKYLLHLFSKYIINPTDDVSHILKECRGAGVRSILKLTDKDLFSPSQRDLRLIKGLCWDAEGSTGYQAGLYNVDFSKADEWVVQCLTRQIDGRYTMTTAEIVFACLMIFVMAKFGLLFYRRCWFRNHEQEDEIEPEEWKDVEEIDDPTDNSKRFDVVEKKLEALQSDIEQKVKLKKCQSDAEGLELLNDMKKFSEKVKIFQNENRCPINQTVMDDPITLSSGIAYNKKDISRWIKTNKLSCPMTRKKLIEDKKSQLSTDVFRQNYINKKLTKFERTLTYFEGKNKSLSKPEIRKSPRLNPCLAGSAPSIK